MTTWTQIKQFLHQKYAVQSDDGDRMTLVLDVSNNRTQLVWVTMVESFIVIDSPVARVEEVTPERILAATATEGCVLGVKRLAGMYVVSTVVPIDDMNDEELIIPIHFAALTADGLERSLGIGDKY